MSTEPKKPPMSMGMAQQQVGGAELRQQLRQQLLQQQPRAEAAVTGSTEDRSKPPDGVHVNMAWGRPFAEIVDGEGGSAALPEESDAAREATALAWAFVDRIRLAERAMIHDVLEGLGEDSACRAVAAIDDHVRREWARTEDDVRARERERIAAVLDDGVDNPIDNINTPGSRPDDIAAWLRENAHESEAATPSKVPPRDPV